MQQSEYYHNSVNNCINSANTDIPVAISVDSERNDVDRGSECTVLPVFNFSSQNAVHSTITHSCFGRGRGTRESIMYIYCVIFR